MPTFKIFYSWQSDLPEDKTRNFIQGCIDDAIAQNWRTPYGLERPWYPQTPNIPIYTGHGFQQPDKTEEDYKLELEEFIASSYGLGFYEFDVETLRPGECRWLSTGMLIKPSDSGIRVNYRICSDHSSGDLNGKLIWLSSET